MSRAITTLGFILISILVTSTLAFASNLSDSLGGTKDPKIDSPPLIIVPRNFTHDSKYFAFELTLDSDTFPYGTPFDFFFVDIQIRGAKLGSVKVSTTSTHSGGTATFTTKHSMKRDRLRIRKLEWPRLATKTNPTRTLQVRGTISKLNKEGIAITPIEIRNTSLINPRSQTGPEHIAFPNSSFGTLTWNDFRKKDSLPVPVGKPHLKEFRLTFTHLNLFSKKLESVRLRDDFGQVSFVVPGLAINEASDPKSRSEYYAPCSASAGDDDSTSFVLTITKGEVIFPPDIFFRSPLKIRCLPDSIAINYGTENWNKEPAFTVVAKGRDGKQYSIDIETRGWNIFAIFIVAFLLIVGTVIMLGIGYKVRNWWRERRRFGTGSFAPRRSSADLTLVGVNQDHIHIEDEQQDERQQPLMQWDGDFVDEGQGVIIA